MSQCGTWVCGGGITRHMARDGSAIPWTGDHPHLLRLGLASRESEPHRRWIKGSVGKFSAVDQDWDKKRSSSVRGIRSSLLFVCRSGNSILLHARGWSFICCVFGLSSLVLRGSRERRKGSSVLGNSLKILTLWQYFMHYNFIFFLHVSTSVCWMLS